MFVPTEGIGSAISKILKETGIRLESLEFNEDRAIAVFFTDHAPQAPQKVRKTARRGKPADIPPATVTDLPEGPWVKCGQSSDGHHHNIWRCGDHEATTREIAGAFGVKVNLMGVRLGNSGYAVTRKHHGKTTDTKVKAMAEV